MQIDRGIAAVLDEAEGGQPRRDYALVRRAIAYLTAHRDDQPGLDRLAGHLGVSPAHAQRTFKRWCGLSPKDFVQALTAEYARSLLADSATVLDAAHEVGLSGSGRLHDLMVTYTAMTPGDVKRRGEGLEIVYGFHDCPFGDALVMMTEHGVCGIGFVDEDAGQTRREALDDMIGRWPRARYREAPGQTGAIAVQIFGMRGGQRDAVGGGVRLVLIGTDFDVRVWEALLRIPMGRAVSYTDIARHIGRPAAPRAVGSAVGRNPISFVVPCHRVLRGDGNLGGYHWGLTRKRALIGWEKGRLVAGDAPSAGHGAR
jgi:AraC family transcriptional regulator, regulatory protein of adaptative response / methylated-DNA-[protein]-cysteine methyltransferase